MLQSLTESACDSITQMQETVYGLKTGIIKLIKNNIFIYIKGIICYTTHEIGHDIGPRHPGSAFAPGKNRPGKKSTRPTASVDGPAEPV